VLQHLILNFDSIILQSDISCRVYHVLVGFLTHFNVWIHIALMIELFVICVFPKKLTSDSSTERAHYLSLLLLSVLLIVNMNYFWTVKRQRASLTLELLNTLVFNVYSATYQQSFISLASWAMLFLSIINKCKINSMA